VLSSPAPGDDDPAAGAPARPDVAARLRTVHMDMVAAVVAGEGLGRVCNLAADAVKAPVAVVVPRLGAYLGGDTDVDVGPLRAYVESRLRRRPMPVPEAVELEVGIESGGETVGAALAIGAVGPEAPDLLHAVSVAVLTELAMTDARRSTSSADVPTAPARSIMGQVAEQKTAQES